MLSRIDCFIEYCVTGLHVESPVQAFELSTTVKNTLSEMEHGQPECIENLRDRVYNLQKLHTMIALSDETKSTSHKIILAGVILTISSFVVVIFASYLIALPLAIAGAALICGALRFLFVYDAKYDAKKLPQEILDVQKDVDSSGAWVQKLKELKDDENLPSDQLEAINAAFAVGSVHMIELKKSF
ncbi:MAG: hypothetical protein H0T62_02065 [Parachlamydiaceae bacterium]|nr:hypothetical protein [Parachlamydiaceae bacterium]